MNQAPNCFFIYLAKIIERKKKKGNKPQCRNTSNAGKKQGMIA